MLMLTHLNVSGNRFERALMTLKVLATVAISQSTLIGLNTARCLLVYSDGIKEPALPKYNQPVPIQDKNRSATYFNSRDRIG